MFRSTVKNEKEGFVGSFNILSILAFEVLKLSLVDGESRPESLKKASSESLTPQKFPPIVQSLGVKPSWAHFLYFCQNLPFKVSIYISGLRYKVTTTVTGHWHHSALLYNCSCGSEGVKVKQVRNTELVFINDISMLTIQATNTFSSVLNN